jgi:UTP--glucose-1-phosphate uridylyltransferase
MKPIRKAILPVAGFGTRFLPATKAQPKEMLPIFDTPAIEHIVREAVAPGIEDIIIVTGRGKRAIEDHFDANFELEYALTEKKKFKELEIVQKLSNMANFVYVRQPQPLGDGHALLCAQSLVEEDEAVVVLFGDDIVDNGDGKNAVQQLMDVYEATGESVVLLEQVPDERVDQYGIVDYTEVDANHGVISRFVEKPKLEEAPSNLGVIGKYILTPNIWAKLKTTKPGPDGEIRLANAFADHLEADGKIYGRVLEGQRFDTGDKIGFLKATLHYALKQETDIAKATIKEFISKQ